MDIFQGISYVTPTHLPCACTHTNYYSDISFDLMTQTTYHQPRKYRTTNQHQSHDHTLVRPLAPHERYHYPALRGNTHMLILVYIVLQSTIRRTKTTGICTMIYDYIMPFKLALKRCITACFVRNIIMPHRVFIALHDSGRRMKTTWYHNII